MVIDTREGDEMKLQEQERMAKKRNYSKPEIKHELDLETRAGSPLNPGDLLPLDLRQK
jgi:hypothetical protein